jgi:hypothetical protein
MSDWMIDLETLGTGDHAPIIQIGACMFHRDDVSGISCPFQRNILMKDWQGIDPYTLNWWMEQEPYVRKKVWAQDNAMSLSSALDELVVHIRNNDSGRNLKLWAHGPQFDLRLIRQACEREKVAWPFSFRDERDYRTLIKEWGRADDFTGLEHLPAHEALADAHRQGIVASRILRRLNR